MFQSFSPISKYLFSFTEVKQEKLIPGNNKSTFWNVTLTTFYFGVRTSVKRNI